MQKSPPAETLLSGLGLAAAALTALLVIKAIPKSNKIPVNPITVRMIILAVPWEMKVILGINVHFGEDAFSASFLRFEPSELITQMLFVSLAGPFTSKRPISIFLPSNFHKKVFENHVFSIDNGKLDAIFLLLFPSGSIVHKLPEVI